MHLVVYLITFYALGRYAHINAKGTPTRISLAELSYTTLIICAGDLSELQEADNPAWLSDAAMVPRLLAVLSAFTRHPIDSGETLLADDSGLQGFVLHRVSGVRACFSMHVSCAVLKDASHTWLCPPCLPGHR